MKKKRLFFLTTIIFMLGPTLEAKKLDEIDYHKCFPTKSVKTMCKPMIMDTGVGGQIIIDAFDNRAHYTLWLRRPYEHWSFCKEVLRNIRGVIRKSETVCFQGDAFEREDLPRTGKMEIYMTPDVVYNDVDCWNYFLDACKKRKTPHSRAR